MYIFEEFKAKKVIIDPRIANHRAIRAYEKAGFKKVKILKNQERHESRKRDNGLMEIFLGSPQ